MLLKRKCASIIFVLHEWGNFQRTTLPTLALLYWSSILYNLIWGHMAERLGLQMQSNDLWCDSTVQVMWLNVKLIPTNYSTSPAPSRLLGLFILSWASDLTLKVLYFWKFTSYCSLKPLWSGMGEVVPARTSSTLHPHPLPLCINCRD